jgi:hypothetical protein
MRRSPSNGVLQRMQACAYPSGGGLPLLYTEMPRAKDFSETH